MNDSVTETVKETRRARLRFWSTIGLAGILAGVVAALILLLTRANADYDQSLNRQSHSLEVISLVRSVDAATARGEAALARFAVGLDKQDGRMFQQQWGYARQYLDLLENYVRDNPEQIKLVKELTGEVEARGSQLGAAALSANYKQGLAAISKYYAAGNDDSLGRINKLIKQIVDNERALLQQRNAIAASDRASLNRVIILFSLLGALAAIIAIAASFSLIRAQGERQLAERERWVESERASELESAVEERTSELAAANRALRSEMADRAHAEAQLRHAQKMDAIGQLTGGIAHDFNNMLAVVVGGLELASRWLTDAPDKARRHIDNAQDGANRAADLTRRLLTFARSEPARPEMVAVDTVIAEFSDLIERTLGDRMNLTLELESDHARCWLDRQQFENALLNLAVNARDAMDGHGRLRIATRTEQHPGGDRIAVAVIDTGCGMSEEVQQRIFDPFYTTKPAGQGTGLGMSQVFAFVRQSSGDAHIKSAEGEGSVITLFLPVGQAGPAEDVLAPVDAATVQPKRALESMKILIVEDDARVLTATVDACTELGHQAVACSDPFKAGAVMAEHGDFDLVLTDVLMPGLTGPELVERLKQQWPDIAILFATGFAGDASEIPSFGAHVVLRKPFTLAALDRALHRCQDGSAELVSG